MTFTARHSLVDLVDTDFNILPILSRFSIPLGFGNRTIGEVCADAGIDVDLFLMIVNYLVSGQIDHAETADPVGIVKFLHNSHQYFLDYKFPHIRENLLGALDDNHSDINPAIVGFFDQYVDSVRAHFAHEEQVLFPYILNLLDGNPDPNYSISDFRRHHDEVAECLAELKNVILRYYTTAVPDRMYDVLVDLCTCHADLSGHNTVENAILVPAIARLERESQTARRTSRRRHP